MRTSKLLFAILSTLTISLILNTATFAQEKDQQTFSILTASSKPATTDETSNFNNLRNLMSRIRLLKPGEIRNVSGATGVLRLHTAGGIQGTCFDFMQGRCISASELVKKDKRRIEVGGGIGETIALNEEVGLAAIATPTRLIEPIELAENTKQGSKAELITAGNNYADPKSYDVVIYDDQHVMFEKEIKFKDTTTMMGCPVMVNNKLFGFVTRVLSPPEDKGKGGEMRVLGALVIPVKNIAKFMSEPIKVKNRKGKFALKDARPIPGSLTEFAAPDTSDEEMKKLTAEATDNRSGLRKFFSKINPFKRSSKAKPKPESTTP